MKLKVLIVEDVQESADLLRYMLRDHANEIIIARDGKQALSVFEEDNDLDLILMDFKLPQMDGYETTRKIREKNKDVVIIAQTAYASAANEKTALEAGCNAYITKPIYKHELFKLIEAHFPNMNEE